MLKLIVFLAAAALLYRWIAGRWPWQRVSEETHFAAWRDQQQHVRRIRQRDECIFHIELFGQFGPAENPAFLLALQDIVHAQS